MQSSRGYVPRCSLAENHVLMGECLQDSQTMTGCLPGPDRPVATQCLGIMHIMAQAVTACDMRCCATSQVGTRTRVDRVKHKKTRSNSSGGLMYEHWGKLRIHSCSHTMFLCICNTTQCWPSSVSPTEDVRQCCLHDLQQMMSTGSAHWPARRGVTCT